MTAVTLGRMAAFYSSVLAALLLLILLLIARFYQRQAQVRSGYVIFLVPAICFLLAGLRYAGVAQGQPLPGAIAGDWIGDWLRLVGGVCLIGEGAYLFSLMTGRQK